MLSRMTFSDNYYFPWGRASKAGRVKIARIVIEGRAGQGIKPIHTLGAKS
jgi:hypothetical protein